MAKYIKIPVEIDAVQWFENGDHPDDDCEVIKPDNESEERFGEGKVVRYYRNPSVDGESKCNRCGKIMDDHGWIETLKTVVCPGDWVITWEDGKLSICKPKEFEETYVEA